jgi:YD repeat-containing protein
VTPRHMPYGYDAAGRLATIQKSGAIITAYTYDLNGNRLQATYPSGNVIGTVDNQDRLLAYGLNTYAYTGNGELKLKVTGVDSTKYRYCGNRRVDDRNDGEQSIAWPSGVRQRHQKWSRCGDGRVCGCRGCACDAGGNCID